MLAELFLWFYDSVASCIAQSLHFRINASVALERKLSMFAAFAKVLDVNLIKCADRMLSVC
jgi:hypothetical protein